MKIRLDRDRVTSGARLTGVVYLERDDEAWRDLVVSHIRTATVDGRTSVERRALLTLSRTAAGSFESEVAFAADTAAEPPTYRGRLLQIEHAVGARATFQEGRVVESQAPLVVEPPGDQSPSTAERESRRGCGTVVGLALILAGFVLVVGSLGALEASLAGVIAALCGFALLRDGLKRHGWGEVAVTIEPLRAAPGSEIVVRAALRPRRKGVLRRADASLEAEEVVELPDPDGHRTHYEPVHRARTTIFEGSQPIEPAGQFTLEARLAIPHDAAPTFRSPAGRLEWQVRLRLEGDGAPWEDTFPIAVVGLPASDRQGPAPVHVSRND